MTSVFRQHRMLLDAFMPLNYLSAVGEYGRKRLRRAPSAPTEVAGDAHRSAAWGARHRKSVTVIVLGETARAKNFSLNGYERTTNPLLATVPGLINFPRAYSCGTDTAQSLPCMFSGMGHAEFSIERARRQEGLLDVLQRVGFDVLWRENQGGCKGVCNGVRTELMEGAGTRTLFELGGARDEKLLEGLAERIAALKGHGVIVLHMMGSHGPAYYKRYPAAFERFKPACKESQFSRCTTSQIVNSYDNTIVYTDYVLFRLIELLRARDVEDVPTAMVYLSDHGELLGRGQHLPARPAVCVRPRRAEAHSDGDVAVAEVPGRLRRRYRLRQAAQPRDREPRQPVPLRARPAGCRHQALRCQARCVRGLPEPSCRRCRLEGMSCAARKGT